jgi:pimeloyl-ACP methyl ester carboxylesterase
MPTLDVDGVSLHVRERGTGETVLLLHSAGNTGAQWAALGDALGDGFRLLAPDLYDCGATSGWTQNREMGYDDVARLLSPLLQQNGPLHLVGHSFGGGVALRLASAYPGCLRTLTLIEPGAYQLLHEAGRNDLWIGFQRVKEDFQRAVTEGDLDAAWALFFEAYCSHLAPWRELPETMRQAIKKKTPDQLRVYGAQASNPTRLSDIRRLHCPTLVIHGQNTQEPERVVCELIATNASLGRIAQVPEAGHMAPLTHPQSVAELLRTHIGLCAG